MLSRASFLCIVFASATGCGDDKLTNAGDADATADALFQEVLVPDGTTMDTSRIDTTPADTTPADSALPDTTPADTTPADTTTVDTNVADTTPADTSFADTNVEDTNVADTTAADTTPEDTSVADTSVADTTSDVAADAGGLCDRNGYTSVAGDALAFDNGDIWYIAQSSLGTPVDVFSIEIYAALGGAGAAGTYTLSDENYDSCGNCVLIQTDCDGNLNDCQRTFLASAGTMTITSIGAIGAQLTAKLTDLVLIEITYDGDYHSTPVPGGDTWCIDSYDLDVTLQ